MCNSARVVCLFTQSQQLATDIAARMPAAGVAALCAALAAASPAMAAVDQPPQPVQELQQKAQSAVQSLDFPGSESKTQVHTLCHGTPLHPIVVRVISTSFT